MAPSEPQSQLQASGGDLRKARPAPRLGQGEVGDLREMLQVQNGQEAVKAGEWVWAARNPADALLGARSHGGRGQGTVGARETPDGAWEAGPEEGAGQSPSWESQKR